MNRRQIVFGAVTTGCAGGLPIPRARAAVALRIRDLYDKDLTTSQLARNIAGQRIDLLGYMAPPPVAKAAFFVLTARPMAFCPFCETEAEWPDDIIAVYTRTAIRIEPFNVMLRVRGVLELGTFVDPLTKFLSKIRLSDAVTTRE